MGYLQYHYTNIFVPNHPKIVTATQTNSDAIKLSGRKHMSSDHNSHQPSGIGTEQFSPRHIIHTTHTRNGKPDFPPRTFQPYSRPHKCAPSRTRTAQFVRPSRSHPHDEQPTRLCACARKQHRCACRICPFSYQFFTHSPGSSCRADEPETPPAPPNRPRPYCNKRRAEQSPDPLFVVVARTKKHQTIICVLTRIVDQLQRA